MTQICYASALREETARRNFFANALALTRATRGKGIVVSSSARSAFELRGPYDVINMATLFGLSEQNAKVSMLSLLGAYGLGTMLCSRTAEVLPTPQHTAQRKTSRHVAPF